MPVANEPIKGVSNTLTIHYPQAFPLFKPNMGIINTGSLMGRDKGP